MFFSSLRALALLSLVFAMTRIVPAANNSPMQGQQAIVGRSGWIKVGLQSVVRKQQVGLPVGGRILDGLDKELGRLTKGSNVFVDGSAGGIIVTTSNGRIGPLNSVTIEPLSPSAGGYFELPSGRYRGRCLMVSRGSGFQIINHLQLDDWLRGVLPAEIGDEAPLEALKAQAVAARSEAVRKLVRPPHADAGFDFCTGVHCQAYKGMKEEVPAANQAVDETFGIVLIANNEVIDAVYHNVCGGTTGSPDEVWDSKPEACLTPVYDRAKGQAPVNLSGESAMNQFLNSNLGDYFCNPAQPGYPNYAKKYFRWQKSMSGDEAGRRAGVGRLKDIQVVDRRPSGRVRKLRLDGDRGSKTIEKELPIRNAFDLWSGVFVVRTERSGGYIQTVEFVGAGNGHGVGLCQMGARTMANLGFKYDQIVAHYYPGSQLKRIYRP
ncbi:MAG: SpoIID/LytB domain-containing protein [Candidatus Sumerlaeaceae bacterium]|nr:SpoIID/LytB domain-containing protein [Candidatus Sumerlaeaceae bacterium]